MHYVLRVPRDENAAVVQGSPTDATESWYKTMYFGKPVTQPVPPLFVSTSEDCGSQFLDAVRHRGHEFIISQRFLDVLQGLGVGNLQAFPLTVIDEDSGAEHSYWLCNVVGAIPCLDRNRAEVEWDDDDPNEVFILKSLAIDEQAIDAFNDGRDPSDRLKLFRLAESPRYILVEQELAQEIRTAGVTGVEFKPPEECGDFK